MILYHGTNLDIQSIDMALYPLQNHLLSMDMLINGRRDT